MIVEIANQLEPCISELRFQQLKRVFENSIDIQLSKLGITSPREVQKVIHYARCSHRLKMNLLQETAFGVSVACLVQQHLCVRGNTGERSIDLMSDTRCKQSNGRQ